MDTDVSLAKAVVLATAVCCVALASLLPVVAALPKDAPKADRIVWTGADPRSDKSYFRQASNPSTNSYEFQYHQLNENQSSSRVQEVKGGAFKVKVIWRDKGGNSGEHMWEYKAEDSEAGVKVKGKFPPLISHAQQHPVDYQVYDPDKPPSYNPPPGGLSAYKTSPGLLGGDHHHAVVPPNVNAHFSNAVLDKPYSGHSSFGVLADPSLASAGSRPTSSFGVKDLKRPSNLSPSLKQHYSNAEDNSELYHHHGNSEANYVKPHVEPGPHFETAQKPLHNQVTFVDDVSSHKPHNTFLTVPTGVVLNNGVPSKHKQHPDHSGAKFPKTHDHVDAYYHRPPEYESHPPYHTNPSSDVHGTKYKFVISGAKSSPNYQHSQSQSSEEADDETETNDDANGSLMRKPAVSSTFGEAYGAPSDPILEGLTPTILHDSHPYHFAGGPSPTRPSDFSNYADTTSQYDGSFSNHHLRNFTKATGPPRGNGKSKSKTTNKTKDKPQTVAMFSPSREKTAPRKPSEKHPSRQKHRPSGQAKGEMVAVEPTMAADPTGSETRLYPQSVTPGPLFYPHLEGRLPNPHHKANSSVSAQKDDGMDSQFGESNKEPAFSTTGSNHVHGETVGDPGLNPHHHGPVPNTGGSHGPASMSGLDTKRPPDDRNQHPGLVTYQGSDGYYRDNSASISNPNTVSYNKPTPNMGSGVNYHPEDPYGSPHQVGNKVMSKPRPQECSDNEEHEEDEDDDDEVEDGNDNDNNAGDSRGSDHAHPHSMRDGDSLNAGSVASLNTQTKSVPTYLSNYNIHDVRTQQNLVNSNFNPSHPHNGNAVNSMPNNAGNTHSQSQVYGGDVNLDSRGAFNNMHHSSSGGIINTVAHQNQPDTFGRFVNQQTVVKHSVDPVEQIVYSQVHSNENYQNKIPMSVFHSMNVKENTQPVIQSHQSSLGNFKNPFPTPSSNDMIVENMNSLRSAVNNFPVRNIPSSVGATVQAHGNAMGNFGNTFTNSHNTEMGIRETFKNIHNNIPISFFQSMNGKTHNHVDFQPQNQNSVGNLRSSFPLPQNNDARIQNEKLPGSLISVQSSPSNHLLSNHQPSDGGSVMFPKDSGKRKRPQTSDSNESLGEIITTILDNVKESPASVQDLPSPRGVQPVEVKDNAVTPPVWSSDQSSSQRVSRQNSKQSQYQKYVEIQRRPPPVTEAQEDTSDSPIAVEDLQEIITRLLEPRPL